MSYVENIIIVNILQHIMYFRPPVSSNNLQRARGTRHKDGHTVYGVQKDMQEESRQPNSVHMHSSSSSVNPSCIRRSVALCRASRNDRD